MNNHHVIIGGMGPQASLKLHELLLTLSGGEESRGPSDYPTILHASLSVPDFIADQSAEAGAVQIINDACEALPLNSAASVGMACNTAHLLLDRIQLPKHNFVSMIDSVVAEIKSGGGKQVGLLASPNTIKSKLYHKALEKEGISVINPSEAEILQLDSIIRRVISGIDTATLRPGLTKIADRMIADGADTILLGCTELPLVGVDVDVPAIDSLSALARTMLQQSRLPAAHRV